MFFSNTTLAGAFIVGVGALLMVLALPGAIVAVLAGVALAIGLVLLNAGLTADKIRSERPALPAGDQAPAWAANVTSEIRHALEANQHEPGGPARTEAPAGRPAALAGPAAGGPSGPPGRPGGLPDLPMMPTQAPVPAGVGAGRGGDPVRPVDVSRPDRPAFGEPIRASGGPAGPDGRRPTTMPAGPMPGGVPIGPGPIGGPVGGPPPGAPTSPAGRPPMPPAGAMLPPGTPYPPRDAPPARPATPGVYGSPAAPSAGLYGSPAAPGPDTGRGPIFEAPSTPPVAPLPPMGAPPRDINPMEDTAVTMAPIRDGDAPPGPRLSLLDDDTGATISHDLWPGGAAPWPDAGAPEYNGGRPSFEDVPRQTRPPLDDLPSRPSAADSGRRPLFDIPPAAMAALDALEQADKDPGLPRRPSLFDIPDKPADE